MISHTNVTEQLVQYFKDNINSGNWKVGEKIPSENQLTEILGVSRASIRTAIQHLVGVGVLESRHGKGTYLLDDQVDEHTGNEMKITSDDCRDIQKVLEFRKIVESEACYLATEKATPELLKELQDCLNEMESNQGKRKEFVTADIRFHEAICRATQNPILEKSMQKVFEETRKKHNQMNEIFGYQEGINYHTMILNAIRSGKAKQAREMMHEHLQNALNRLENEEQ
ncbi:MAG: FadR/GntR family transcriptional regulator [Oliverpabstia sp.]